jgi:hypothetical protein
MWSPVRLHDALPLETPSLVPYTARNPFILGHKPPNPFFSSMCLYRSCSILYFRTMATQSTSMKSIPTIPKAAVKIWSKYLFANDENLAMHPPFCAATRVFRQVLSLTNGGVVELT